MLKKVQSLLVIIFISLIPIDGYLIYEYGIIGFSHIFFFLFVVSYHLDNGLKLNVGKDIKILLCLYLVFICSIVFSDSFATSLYQLATIGYYLIIYIYVSSISKYNVELLFWLYSLSLLVLCSYVYFFGQETLLSNRFSYHIDYNPTWLAVHLTGVVFLGMAYFPQVGRIKKYLIFVIGCYAIYFIILTQGRTTLFSLIGVYIFYLAGISIKFLVSFKKQYLKQVIISFLGVLVLFGVLIYYYEIIYYWTETNTSRILITFQADNADLATANRASIWLTYLSEIVHNPLPNGIGTSLNKSNTPHNTYILLVSEASIIALLIWLYFHFKITTKCKLGSSAWFLSMFLLVASFGNDFIYYKYYWTSLYLFLFVSRCKYQLIYEKL